ncbi:MAG: recombinase family protein [Anaerolineales bacterium]|nr:recombinase family protein [Anaerolineales bacterium]
MNTTTQPSSKAWLPPASLAELEQYVQRAIGSVAGHLNQERAAVYSRVSSIDQHARSYSMEFQPDRSEEYVRSKGWLIAGLYADPDRTGRNSKRPGLQRMIRDIESGKITVVVVHRLDRLYRNLESLLRFLRFLKKHHVRLVSVTEQIDTDSWWGRLVLYVLGALAEMYVWQTSVRVREIKAELSRKGHHNGTVPIGYCNGLCSTCSDLNGPGYCPLAGGPDRPESQRGRIPVAHPVDRHAILLAHTLYNQGMSYQDIANHFNLHHFRLPDGQEVQLRTKCSRNKRPGRPFHRDSIREIICNPFYVGMVVRRPNPPLDMDDDRAPGVVESTAHRKPRKLPDGLSRRSILEMHRGRHDGVIPLSLWQANQQERKSRGNTPRGGNRPLTEYLLAGVGYCWECHHWDGRQATLRGITGNRHKYYRCSTVQNEYKTRCRHHPDAFHTALDTLGLGAEEQTSKLALLERHRSTLQQNLLEEQVAQLMAPFAIPEEWYDLILAYYLSDKGMSEFELGGYNLRQELSRQRELYKRGHITQAEYEQAFLCIDRQLQKLSPSAQPGAREIIPLLNDFPALWQRMTLTERRALLQAMFAGLYFDSQCQLRKVSARSPFDELLS